MRREREREREGGREGGDRNRKGEYVGILNRVTFSYMQEFPWSFLGFC